MNLEVQPVSPATPAVPAPPGPARPPRVWPAVLLVLAYWGYAFISDGQELTTFVRFMSRLITGGLLVLLLFVWWWAGRRVSFRDRLLVFAVFVGAGVVGNFFFDPSLQGMSLLMGPVAFVCSVWVLGMVLVARTSPAVRRWGLVTAVTLAWGVLALARVDSLSGDLRPTLHWRWTPTSEDLFFAWKASEATGTKPESAPSPAAPLTLAPGDWPGFRGPNRDSTLHGVTVRTDWKAHPPRRVWRHRIGPGWSSLVLVGGRLFTQEQRDQQEAVVCYDAARGKEVWVHGDANRFSEVTAGAGPRATPCFADGRLFALGPTGLLNCLDAATGKKLWTRDIKAASGASVPMWGFAGSPLVVGDLVVVFAGGEGPKNLLAYRAASGELAWTAPAGETSYSSPQPASLDGVPQVLQLTNRGLTSVDPTTGAVLWEHSVPLPASAPRSIQPHVLGKDGVLIASEGDFGLARLDVKHEGGSWRVAERWTSRRLKPSFNDFVVQGGHAYGFDGRIFACVELDKGRGRWKEGRYGFGQVLLLADPSLLLVVTDEGRVVLLRADPKRHEELGRFPALEEQTWNHPVLAHGRLYLRNGAWMACYELEPAGGR